MQPTPVNCAHMPPMALTRGASGLFRRLLRCPLPGRNGGEHRVGAGRVDVAGDAVDEGGGRQRVSGGAS